jgi:hypothetical protein
MVSKPLHLICELKWEWFFIFFKVVSPVVGLFNLVKNLCSLLRARKAQPPSNIVIVQNSPGSTIQIYAPKRR